MEYNLELLKSEMDKRTFVLNNMSEKIYILEREVKENTFLSDELMTLLINFSCVDKISEFIVYETDIILDLTTGGKGFDDELFLWFITNLSISGIELYQILLDKYEIFDYIAELDIYDNFSDNVLWSFTQLNKRIGEYYSTQLLYMIMKMSDSFIYRYIRNMWQICRMYPKITNTFVLENGLFIIYDNYERTEYCGTFLILLFRHNSRDKYFLEHLYFFYENLLYTKLYYSDDDNVLCIFNIIKECIDISEKIDVDLLLEKVEKNNNYVTNLYVIDLLSHEQFSIHDKHLEILLPLMLEDYEEIEDIGCGEYYIRFLLNCRQLWRFTDKFEIIKLLKHLAKLEHISYSNLDIMQIYSYISNTLKYTAYYNCLKSGIDIPDFINIIDLT